MKYVKFINYTSRFILILIIVILPSIISTQAQEMISKIASSSDNSRNFLEKVNGKNYLLTIYHDDELEIGEIDSVLDYKFINKLHLEGIFNDSKILIHNNWICSRNNDGYILHDFINNKSFIESVPDSFFVFNWKFPDDNGVIMELMYKHVYYTKPVYVSFADGEIKDFQIPRLITNRKEDYLSAYSEGSSSNNFVKNFKTEKIIKLNDRKNVSCVADFNGDYFWVQIDSGNVYEYNMLTDETFVYKNESKELFKFNRVLEKDSLLYVFSTGLGKINLQVFSRDTKLLLYNEIFEFEYIDGGDVLYGYIWGAKFKIHDDFIIGISNDTRKIIIVNLITKKVNEFSTYFEDIDNLKILDNGNIINFHDGHFKLINMLSMGEKTLAGNQMWPNIVYNNYLKFGDDIIGVLDYGNKIFNYENRFRAQNIFNINLHELSYKYNESLKFTNGGIRYNTQIKNYKDGIIVLFDDFYFFKDSLIKINTNPIQNLFRGKTYTFDEENIYFLQKVKINNKDRYELCKFDGNHMEILFDGSVDFPFSKKIVEFNIIDEIFYYVDSDNVMYRLNINTKEHEKIEEKVGLSAFRGDLLYKFKSVIYYDSDGLKSIENYKEPALISDDYQLIYEYLFKINDKLFILLADKLFEVVSNELIPMATFESTSQRLYFDKNGENVLIKDGSTDIYHFDGQDLHDIGLIPNQIKYLSGSFFVINNSLYDTKTKQILNLPSNIVGEDVISCFYSEIDTILIVKTLVNTENEVKVYKVNNSFSDFNIVASQKEKGNFENPKFYNFDKEGLLYSVDKLFIMNKDFEFNFIDNVKGIITFSNVLRQNDYLYFVGNDKYWGNQLFRTVLPSSTGINYESSNFKRINIYPNPASKIIYIEGNIDFKTIVAFSIDGHDTNLLRNSSNSIDISNLNTGNYILIMEGKDHKFYYSKLSKIKSN